jgi:hypothetical protein
MSYGYGPYDVDDEDDSPGELRGESTDGRGPDRADDRPER